VNVCYRQIAGSNSFASPYRLQTDDCRKSKMSFFEPNDPASAWSVGTPVVAPGYTAKKEHSRLRKALGSAAAAVAAAVKWGVLIFSKLKFAGVLLTMLISVGAYTIFFGWEFAVGLVLLLLVHEYGHVIQLHREGVAATAPRFIPFLGAYIGIKELPKDAAAEARVGLAGPIAGSLAALVPLFIYAETGSSFWRGLAYFGFFLQLFNLAPVLPLDGGRAMAAISTKVWIAGWLGMLALALYTLSPIIFLVLIFGAFELRHRWGTRHQIDKQRYHQVRARTRLLIGCVYLILVLGCGYATVSLYDPASIHAAESSQVGAR
jgi:Zn-dependent protease